MFTVRKVNEQKVSGKVEEKISKNEPPMNHLKRFNHRTGFFLIQVFFLLFSFPEHLSLRGRFFP